MNDRKEYFRKRYLQKRDEILKQHADYRSRNRESLKEKARIYNQENRDARRKQSVEYRKKNTPKCSSSYEARAAHSKAAWATKSGKLNREPCGECGAEDSIKHHADYAFPLAVTWLCKDCHSRLHRSMGTYGKYKAPAI